MPAGCLFPGTKELSLAAGRTRPNFAEQEDRQGIDSIMNRCSFLSTITHDKQSDLSKSSAGVCMDQNNMYL